MGIKCKYKNNKMNKIKMQQKLNKKSKKKCTMSETTSPTEETKWKSSLHILKEN